MKSEVILKELGDIKEILKKNVQRPLNLVEAAKYLSISQSHLYKLTSQRKIIFHKPNGKYLYFFKEELDEWVRSGKSEPEKGREGEGANEDASTEISTDEDEEPP